MRQTWAAVPMAAALLMAVAGSPAAAFMAVAGSPKAAFTTGVFTTTLPFTADSIAAGMAGTAIGKTASGWTDGLHTAIRPARCTTRITATTTAIEAAAAHQSGDVPCTRNGPVQCPAPTARRKHRRRNMTSALSDWAAWALRWRQTLQPPDIG